MQPLDRVPSAITTGSATVIQWRIECKIRLSLTHGLTTAIVS